MLSVERLQAYLHQAARQQYEPVAIPPFTLYLHPQDDFPHFNYAIPNRPIHEGLVETLDTLKSTFAAHKRHPRFEFIEGFAPYLGSLLEAAGFEQEGCYPLLVCTPESLRPPSAVPGLAITSLSPASPVQDIQDFLTVQQLGFDSTATGVASEKAAEARRPQLAHGQSVLGRLDGEAVGVGGSAPPIAGLTEIQGIATLAPFRRRGIATALTGHLLQEAFAAGVQTAFLTAGDDAAGRVYERVGFYRFATSLAYRLA